MFSGNATEAFSVQSECQRPSHSMFDIDAGNTHTTMTPRTVVEIDQTNPYGQLSTPRSKVRRLERAMNEETHQHSGMEGATPRSLNDFVRGMSSYVSTRLGKVWKGRGRRERRGLVVWCGQGQNTGLKGGSELTSRTASYEGFTWPMILAEGRRSGRKRRSAVERTCSILEGGMILFSQGNNSVHPISRGYVKPLCHQRLSRARGDPA